MTNNGINLMAVVIANLMGIIALFTTICGNSWRIKARTKDNNILMIIVATSFVACVMDPICFYADGKEGGLMYFAVFACNTVLYGMNLILGPSWLLYLANYFGIKLNKFHKILVLVAYVAGLVMLILNIFYPIVFSVDETNTYQRELMYMYFLIIQSVALLDGLVLYFITKIKSGKLKFFPVWAFIIPAVVGMVIQTMFYGVSTIWPFIAVSVSGVVSSLQNQLLFRDKLTGLFNRFYLNMVETTVKGRKEARYSVMMLDLNGFKQINDNFGHKVGDEALILTADILKKIVGSLGEVIRYAGDEFIIILNTANENKINEIIGNIHTGFDKVSKSDKYPYDLSVSIGYSMIDMHYNSIDELIDETDKKMYLEKNKYYETHDRRL